MDAQTLADAMQNSLGIDDYQRFTPGFNNALVAAKCTTVNRVAMFCAQTGHESAGLRYMEEIADGSQYEWRQDLGNTQPGDGPRYKGSGPIQLTGRHNFGLFSEWAHANGYCPTPTYYVDHPETVRDDPKAGFLAASWYWVVARDMNSYADAGDIRGATVAVNGGLNGFSDREQRWRHALTLGARLLPSGIEVRPPVEKVLDYPRGDIKQDTGYFCGPASSQTVILSKTGNLVAEQELARLMGTTTNGTDHIGLIAPVLNRFLPEAKYTAVEMPNDPPKAAEKQRLWEDVVRSINGGYGVVMNFVAPPSNYPRGVNGSQSPAYSGGTVYHYVACMGYRDDMGSKAFWIADSGFPPYGYWCSFEQIATLIPPKGYAAATASSLAPLAPAKPGGPAMPKTDNQLLIEIHDQLCGWDGKAGFPGWPQTGQKTAIDAIAAIGAVVARIAAKTGVEAPELKGFK